ncbi:MAG: chorismate mutase, partial [Pseudomonadales bacterium]
MTSEKQLNELRNQIDELDSRILDLVNQRARCAQKVADVKTDALAE